MDGYEISGILVHGLQKRADKELIQCGGNVAVAVDEHVLVDAVIVLARQFHKVVALQNLGRNEREPHEGFMVLAEQLELAGAFKDIDLAVVFRALLFLERLGERKGRHGRICVRDLNIVLKVGKIDLILAGKRMLAADDEAIAELCDQVCMQVLFLQHGLEGGIVAQRIADNAQTIVFVDDVFDGGAGVRLVVEDLRSVGGKQLGEADKGFGKLFFPET